MFDPATKVATLTKKNNKKNEFICAKLAKKLVIVPSELKSYYILF